MLAGLLLRRIFSHNQEHFTGGEPIIPVIAIVEEAQSVLGRNLDDTSPYVEWVKEGRKYELGALLVTQQPGAMASELLSQADNWFCFHLLSEGDASILGRYNSHYSSDIRAHLIAEPIAGNCYMWSAPHQPFVLPVRLRDFGGLYRCNIRNDEQAQVGVETGATVVAQSTSESMSNIKGKVLEQLRQSSTKYYRIPDAISSGEEGIGVFEGQLYYILKHSKNPEETRTENDLKRPVMTLLLGEGNLNVASHNGKQYYCASKECWINLLGRVPDIKEP